MIACVVSPQLRRLTCGRTRHRASARSHSLLACQGSSSRPRRTDRRAGNAAALVSVRCSSTRYSASLSGFNVASRRRGSLLRCRSCTFSLYLRSCCSSRCTTASTEPIKLSDWSWATKSCLCSAETLRSTRGVRRIRQVDDDLDGGQPIENLQQLFRLGRDPVLRRIAQMTMPRGNLYLHVLRSPRLASNRRFPRPKPTTSFCGMRWRSAAAANQVF